MTPPSVLFPYCNATEKKHKHTISSSCAEAFASPIFGVLFDDAPALSLDELIADSKEPNGDGMSGYGSISESTKGFGETGVPSKPEDARSGSRVVLGSLLLVRIIRLSPTFTSMRIKMERI